MGSRPGPDAWTTWLPSPARTLGNAAYGDGQWVLWSETFANNAYTFTFYATPDARRTTAWPTAGTLTTNAMNSTGHKIAYGNGYWVLFTTATSIAYSTNGAATWSIASMPGSVGDMRWTGDRWVATFGGAPYVSSSSPTGPWTQLGTTGSVGFSGRHIAYGNGLYLVSAALVLGVTGATTPVPFVAASTGNGSWTTVYSAVPPTSSGVNIGSEHLEWSQDQGEWVALWNNTTFVASRFSWGNASATSWASVGGSMGAGSYPAGAVGTGGGYQYISLNNTSSQTQGLGAYRQVDSWGSSTAWTTVSTSSGGLPIGLYTIAYGDGYWVVTHDNNIAGTSNYRVSASPELDDSFWGISLDDY